jgi:hypothetical protein
MTGVNRHKLHPKATHFTLRDRFLYNLTRAQRKRLQLRRRLGKGY